MGRGTSEIVEFEMGLGPVCEEIGVVRAQVNGLREEVNGEFEAVVHKGFFCLLCNFKRTCHGWADLTPERQLPTNNKIIKNKKKAENSREKERECVCVWRK